jgi:hypothetical protein
MTRAYANVHVLRLQSFDKTQAGVIRTTLMADLH